MKKYLYCILLCIIFNLFSGCYPSSNHGAEPEPDPVLFGCKNNATGKASSLNLVGQSIVNQMKPSQYQGYDYMWEYTTSSACPNGAISGYFHLEITKLAESYIQMVGYRTVTNEHVMEERTFYPQLLTITGLDLSAYDAQCSPEKVCNGCPDEATFQCKMYLLVKVTPPAGYEKLNFIANNITGVKMNLNYTGY